MDLKVIKICSKPSFQTETFYLIKKKNLSCGDNFHAHDSAETSIKNHIYHYILWNSIMWQWWCDKQPHITLIVTFQ
jgi:hypothetical protein